MSRIAVKTENLGKRYRIGAHLETVSGRKNFLDIISHFNYLRTTLRAPTEAEIVWALKDVSFEINQGEVVGFIGRNGAGKSTLLKLLSRITEPTTGRAFVYGRTASLLEVGTGFHPDLTGRENIFVNGTILGLQKPEIERRFDEIVAFAEMDKFIDTPVKYYSSGMYVRLAFSVSAHLEPEILMIDEILAVGDIEFQRKCLGKMENVAGEGRTVLFVSHNINALERLCTRGILLANGRLVDDGPIGQVTNKYQGLGMTRIGERVWEDSNLAPGDQVVKLHAIRTCNRNDEITTNFSVQEPVKIKLEFSVLEDGHTLDASFCFYDEAGNIIFSAGDFQNDEWNKRPRPKGLHTSICTIPANLLNEGRISIMVAVAENPHTLHAIENDVVAIEIYDAMSPGGARGHYTREWAGGAVRPLLQWDFTYDSKLPG